MDVLANEVAKLHNLGNLRNNNSGVNLELSDEKSKKSDSSHDGRDKNLVTRV